MKTLIFYILLLFCLTGSAQNIYFPPNGSDDWDTISYQSLGYCEEGIDSLYEYLESTNSKAFILLKDGKIVLEKYFGTFTKDSAWYWASAGKTITAFLTGIAQEQGHLLLSDSSSNFLGQGWTSCTPSQESKIQIVHQLSMSTGLNDKNVNLDCTEDTCLQYEADAGTRWSYHNAPYTLLRNVIENATGTNINSYAFQNLMQPTGMSGSFIKLGFNNVFFSKARSMARFGLLIQNKGVWNGNSILSDTAYFNSMVNTSQAMNESYGYLWWLNGKESFMVPTLQNVFPGSLHPDAPDDMVSALGKNGQILNVIPSKNMVWIRMGSNPDNEDGLVSITYNNRIWQRINKLDCKVSTLQEINEPFIKVFPNPASEYLMIKSNSQIQYVEILDLNAKVLASHQLNKNLAQIDVSSLPNGLYILKCVTPQGIELKKISIFNSVHQ